MISCGFSSNQSIDCYSSHPQQKHIEHDRTIIYYGFVYCFRLRCVFFIFVCEFPYYDVTCCTSIQLNPCLAQIRSVTLRDPQASTLSGSAICPHEAEGC